MNIVQGQNVDLISPFPSNEARRIFGWTHCYRTFAETDDTPKNIDEFTVFMEGVLHGVPSWGIIDKNQLTNTQHEAPLVGVGVFEPATIRGGYIHLASARKAFRVGLIDEAASLLIKTLFEIPTLLRVGTYLDERNSPLKSLFRRLGFKLEGVCEDMILRDGMQRNLVYFGLTRRNWSNHQEEHVINAIQPEDSVSIPAGLPA